MNLLIYLILFIVPRGVIKENLKINKSCLLIINTYMYSCINQKCWIHIMSTNNKHLYV